MRENKKTPTLCTKSPDRVNGKKKGIEEGMIHESEKEDENWAGLGGFLKS
jgi:hypothetical protein